MLTRPVEDPREERGAGVADHALLALVRSPEPVREAAPSGDGDALAALGYVGREAPQAGSSGPPADPRTQQALIVALDRANTDLVGGRAGQALATLDAAAAAHGELPELLLLRGKALAALERWDEAVDALARASAARPTADLLIEHGRALLLRARAAGRQPVDAVPVLDAALAAAPGEPRAVALRALAEVSSGDAAAACARLDAALADRPRDLTLLSVKLQALVALGREADAAALRAKLGALWPDHPALQSPGR
jgi:tetratricopeptide (TPR) repeat protein